MDAASRPEAAEEAFHSGSQWAEKTNQRLRRRLQAGEDFGSLTTFLSDVFRIQTGEFLF